VTRPLPRRAGGVPLLVLLSAVALMAAACGSVSTPAPATPSAPAVSPTTATSTLAPPPSGSDSVSLTVFAASSLTEALAAAKTAYETATPGVTLNLTFGPSTALRGQLEQGTPADLFLSDDLDNATALVDGGLTSGDAQAFAGNSLALIAPKATPAKVAKAVDLAKPGVRIAGAAKDDPLTAYTSDLVAGLAKIKGYPAGYAASVEKNTVSHEGDDRAVLAKVQAGDVDAGFVYATDAQLAGAAVRNLVLPPDLNLPGTYAGVVIRDRPGADAATAFLVWLSGPDGQAVLGQFGFVAPSQ